MHFERLKMPKSKKLKISVWEVGRAKKKATELKCLNLNALIACKDKKIYIQVGLNFKKFEGMGHI